MCLLGDVEKLKGTGRFTNYEIDLLSYAHSSQFPSITSVCHTHSTCRSTVTNLQSSVFFLCILYCMHQRIFESSNLHCQKLTSEGIFCSLLRVLRRRVIFCSTWRYDNPMTYSGYAESNWKVCRTELITFFNCLLLVQMSASSFNLFRD